MNNMEVLDFLREKGLLNEDKTQFIIRLQNGIEHDVVELLQEFSLKNQKLIEQSECEHGYKTDCGKKLFCATKSSQDNSDE